MTTMADEAVATERTKPLAAMAMSYFSQNIVATAPEQLRCWKEVLSVNTLRSRQNAHHFADDFFKYIFLTENVWSSIKISLNFVPKGRINNIPALAQIMASRRRGNKPLTETMMVSLLTYIWVTRPQWVNQVSR